MAYVLACLLGLLAAGQASIISTGLSGYNGPLLSHGFPLTTGALSPYVHHTVGAPSVVPYTAPIAVQNQYVQAAPVAVAAHAGAAYAVAAPTVAAPAVAGYAAPVAAIAAPVAAVAAPVVTQAVAPVAAPVDVKTQYHSQDEQGRYRFGYTDGSQSREEQRDAYGRVTGSYSYVDEYGRVNSQAYVADEGGFRVTGNNLPVHHVGKRSLAAYPASTGPLVHGYHHHVPALAHPGYHVAPEIRTVHQVAHHVAAPVSYAAAPVAHVASPVAHHVASPVAYAAAPVAHVAAPVAHVGASVAHVAHGQYGGYAVPNRVSYATHGTAPVYG